MAFLDLMRPPATNISQENEGGTQYGKIIIFNKYAFAQKLVKFNILYMKSSQ